MDSLGEMYWFQNDSNASGSLASDVVLHLGKGKVYVSAVYHILITRISFYGRHKSLKILNKPYLCDLLS